MRFSIWAAVSTQEQAKDDKTSLPNQENSCRNIGNTKGWHDTGLTYIVPGASRTRYVNLRDAEEDIPQLSQMLEDAKNSKFDLLILYDFNRLRDLLDLVAKSLSTYGIQIFSISQPVEPIPPEEFNPYASDSESMMRGMSQIISRWQIADLRRKYRFGVRGRVESGLPSLKIPFGYIKPPGMEAEPKVVPIPHPVHSTIILDIKNRFISGMSTHELADYLTQHYPTPTGIPSWSRTTILKILRNPFYAGKVSFGRRLTVNDPRLNKKRLVNNPDPFTREGAHKPLYSFDEFLSIQVELDRRSTLPNMARYPWSGLLSCAECGHRLRRKTQRYSCVHCHTVTIWDHELPLVVPPAIRESLLHVKPMHAEGFTPVSTSPVLNDLDRQRKRIHQAYEAELYTLQEAEEKIKAIDSKIAALKNTGIQSARSHAERLRFELAVSEIIPIINSLPQWITKDDPKVVNSLLLRLFISINITHERKAIPVLRG
jgi:site-specific DNA recombinase